MEIKFKLLGDGGFVVGDVETGLTAYAYPSSTSAFQAVRRPLSVATAMLAERCRMPMPDYEARNWAILNGRA